MLIHRLNTAVAAVTATTTAMTSFLGFLVFAIALATSMMATTVSAYGGVRLSFLVNEGEKNKKR